MTGGANSCRAAQAERNNSGSSKGGSSDNSDYVETTHNSDGSVTTKSVIDYTGSAPDNRIQHKKGS